jgi:hypothetical protein
MAAIGYAESAGVNAAVNERVNGLVNKGVEKGRKAVGKERTEGREQSNI